MNTCPVCGKAAKRTYCSQVCHATTRRSGASHCCPNCHLPFYASLSMLSDGEGKFCSDPCRRAYQRLHAKGYPKKGRIAIHRTVAEQVIGRRLLKGETVHHIDGNRQNNAPSNLIVFQSQAAHMAAEFASGKVRIGHDQAVNNGRKSGISRRAVWFNQSNRP